MKKRQQQRGFTLIEVMIVVAIIALLAGIAWPSYQNQVRSSNRADAQGALMGLAQAMERHYTENGTYEEAAAGGGDTGSPAIFPSEAPLDGSRKYYDLEITDATETGYELTASPKSTGVQAGDGDLTLSSTGERLWDEKGSGTTKPW